MNVENLELKVSYKVGLSDLNLPTKVFEQLVESFEEGKEIRIGSFENRKAQEWVSNNIQQGDAMECVFEVEDFNVNN